MKNKSCAIRGSLLSTVALSAVAVAQTPAVDDTQPALEAAQTAQPLTEIVVTGSRLRTRADEQVAPIQAIDAEAINARALPDVAAIVAEMPTFGAGSSRSGLQGRFGVGQSFADFFSLGSQRTLTVVNGRRFVSSNPAVVFYGGASPGSQVDLNVIPTMLIDRVETVAVGGAPIYGSDAIAGTLNVILKDRYEGAEVEAEGSFYDHGGGQSWRTRGLYGVTFAEGRGSFVASAEYYDSEGLLQSDRARSSQSLIFAPPADPSSPHLNVVTRDARLTLFTPDGLPLVGLDLPSAAGVRDAEGRLLTFGQDGNLRPFDLGRPTGLDYLSTGGEGYRASDFKNLLGETRRGLGAVLFNYDLSDRVSFFTEGYAAQVKSRTMNNEPNYFTVLPGEADGNIVLSLDNPFLSPAARQIIADNIAAHGSLDDTNTFVLARTNNDLIEGDTRAKIDLWRIVTGLSGPFQLGERELSWEVAFNYGRSTAANSEPAILEQNFFNALDAVRLPNGEIACRPGAVSADYPSLSSTCAPLNMFGAGSPSAAAMAYISTFARSRAVNTQRAVTASVQGELFELPAGAIRGVLGYENRRESATFDVDRFYEEDLGLDVTAEDSRGSFSTKEVFAELRIPLISPANDVPLINALELHEAFRYVDHSTAGGDPTYTTGINYSPANGLLLRGNYTRSIRSPAISEVNLPAITQFVNADDPCDSRFVTSGPNPGARAANCAAAGLPADFDSLIVDETLPVTQAGNPGLQNEKADAWSIGFSIQPESLPGTLLSVDWINIDVSDAIELLDVETMLKTCYDSSNYPENITCGLFSREVNGQIGDARQTYVNAGSVEMRGLVANVGTRFGMPGRLAAFLPGRVSMQLNYFYLDRLRTSITATDATQRAGTIGNSRNMATLLTSYDSGPFSFGLDATFVGKSVFDRSSAPNTYDHAGVDDWIVFDSHLAYTFGEQFTLRLMVSNLLDQQAPWPIPVNDIGIGTYDQGLLGRQFTMRLSTRF